MKCQKCGNDKAKYNTETMSAALCPDCTEDYKRDAMEPYDYANERTIQEKGKHHD